MGGPAVNKYVNSVLANWRDSMWWQQIAFPYLARMIHRQIPHFGIDVPEEDWDNLIILDACRYDMFEELNTLPGELTKRTSAAANTPEFLQTNFAGGDFSDTVYVTANPQVNVHLDDEFFEIVNVWEDHWDDDLHTVPPKAMADKTIEAYRSYPNKRLIAHFVQPHYPFIGETGRNELGRHSGMELSKRLATDGPAARDSKSVWERLYEGTVSEEVVWRAYEENLSLVLPHVERIVKTVDERTVVTSDHGNAVGERAWPVPVRIYGHPPDIRIPSLVDVPWLVVEGERRKEIVAEEAEGQTEELSEDVSDRLADLGYT